MNRILIDENFKSASLRYVSLALGLFVGLVYSYPMLATIVQTGPGLLPPLLSPDQNLYLKLGTLDSTMPGMVTNPWYGIAVQGSELLYVKFGLAFQIFHLLFALTNNSYVWATMLFNFGVMFAIGLACFRLFEKAFPSLPPICYAAATLACVFVEVTSIPGWVASAAQFVTGRGSLGLSFPYGRLFFPQSAVPLLLVFLSLEIVVLRARSLYAWILLWVVQLLALMIFPHVLLVMVGSLTVGQVLLGAGGRFAAERAPNYWKDLGLFCLASVVVDLIFLWTTGTFATGLVRTDGGMVRIAFSEAGHYFGLAVVLLAVLSAAVLVLARRTRSSGGVVLAALGLAVLLLHWADLIFTPRLQISHHTDYFVNTALTLLLGWLGFYIYSASRTRFGGHRMLRVVPAGLAIGLGLLGGLTAQTVFARNFLENAELAGLVKLVAALNLTGEDLVIAPAKTVDDPSAWVPVVSRAQVLYARNAEFVLDHAALPVQDERLARQLYFAGMTPSELARVLDPNGGTLTEQARIIPVGERFFYDTADWERVLGNARERLMPLTKTLEGNPAEMSAFLKQYARVVVIDTRNDPDFAAERLVQHLKVDEMFQTAHYGVWVMEPLGQ